MKKSLLVALGLMSVFCLAACNKNTNVETVDENIDNENEQTGMANPASVYCEEQGGTLELMSDENGEYGVCNLPDGTVCEEWSFYRGECGPVVAVNLPEGAAHSLTIADLDEIDAVLFPTSYTYEQYGLDGEEMKLMNSGEYVYPEDIDHSLLIPEHATMASREIESSSIEDGMVYTLANVTLQDETVLSVLYINDPVTLQYIAASVNNGTETTLYTFAY